MVVKLISLKLTLLKIRKGAFVNIIVQHYDQWFKIRMKFVEYLE